MGKIITYAPQEFDVPIGTYLCRFAGVRDKPPFKESAYGDNEEPRYGWQFEVIGPAGNPAVGKVIEQNTGTRASAKSGLVRLLNMMLAAQGGLQPGQSVDPDTFKGRVYNVQWMPNPESKKGNPWIAFLTDVAPPPNWQGNPPHTPVAHVTPPAQQASQPAPQPQPAAPPPRNKQKAPSLGKPRLYFVDDPDVEDAPLLPHTEVQAWINRHKTTAADTLVCVEGATQWSPATVFGFTDAPDASRGTAPAQDEDVRF